MSEKHYQITAIELVQWAEPLFSRAKEPAEGFSEELIASYEKAAGIKLPAALRDFYLACGQASINDRLHPILIPEKDAKPFHPNISFSHDYIEDEMQDFRKHDESGNEEQERVWALPKERWDEAVTNYLMFWTENQGCWMAGIRKEDLDQPNPPVYFNDEDTMYHWAIFADSLQSFLLTISLENLAEGLRLKAITDSAEIQAILDEAGVDFQRLQEPYPFPGGRFAHTCLDLDNNSLYVYSEEAEGRPAYLQVIKPKD